MTIYKYHLLKHLINKINYKLFLIFYNQLLYLLYKFSHKGYLEILLNIKDNYILDIINN